MKKFIFVGISFVICDQAEVAGLLFHYSTTVRSGVHAEIARLSLFDYITVRAPVPDCLAAVADPRPHASSWGRANHPP